MIVFNITTHVAHSIAQEWEGWMKEELIPRVMVTGLFTEWKMFRLLEQDETEGITFIVQYFTSSLKNYYQYVEEFAPQMQQLAIDKWQDKFLSFKTIMQVVN